jgi:hypothetical protein
VFALAFPASAASDLEAESFRGTDVTSSVWVAGFGACLTAGTDPSSLPVPGCGLDSPDAAGDGVLRLTDTTPFTTGWLLHDRALPTVAGLDVTFTMSQWGGSDADGISFFVTKGSYPLVGLGGVGGSLGYAPGGGEGLAHALLGVGFDALGNFSDSLGGSGCEDAPHQPGFVPDAVVVRGPGHQYAGYCLLGGTHVAPLGFILSGSYWDEGAQEWVPGTRAGAAIDVRVRIDAPDEANPGVHVSLDGVPVLSVDLPAEYLAEPTIKFGFAGSNGEQYNNHEIWDFGVATIETLPATGASPGGVIVWATFLFAVGMGVMLAGSRRLTVA